MTPNCCSVFSLALGRSKIFSQLLERGGEENWKQKTSDLEMAWCGTGMLKDRSTIDPTVSRFIMMFCIVAKYICMHLVPNPRSLLKISLTVELLLGVERYLQASPLLLRHPPGWAVLFCILPFLCWLGHSFLSYIALYCQTFTLQQTVPGSSIFYFLHTWKSKPGRISNGWLIIYPCFL